MNNSTVSKDGIVYNDNQIANDLLATFEGQVFLSVDPKSIFNMVEDTADFYGFTFNEAKYIHNLAMLIYLNEEE